MKAAPTFKITEFRSAYWTYGTKQPQDFEDVALSSSSFAFRQAWTVKEIIKFIKTTKMHHLDSHAVILDECSYNYTDKMYYGDWPFHIISTVLCGFHCNYVLK